MKFIKYEPANIEFIVDRKPSKYEKILTDFIASGLDQAQLIPEKGEKLNEVFATGLRALIKRDDRFKGIKVMRRGNTGRTHWNEKYDLIVLFREKEP